MKPYLTREDGSPAILATLQQVIGRQNRGVAANDRGRVVLRRTEGMLTAALAVHDHVLELVASPEQTRHGRW